MPQEYAQKRQNYSAVNQHNNASKCGQEAAPCPATGFSPTQKTKKQSEECAKGGAQDNSDTGNTRCRRNHCQQYQRYNGKINAEANKPAPVFGKRNGICRKANENFHRFLGQFRINALQMP